ncbi:hypothetical protein M2132_002233 [Dysgonomonas sp. PH5-45]|uniref:TonB-dependent receptor n=1 Tax=unclassified Dysgonomonas TaxID=2630389 RepID=UPI0024747EAB|nr:MULTISPECIES: carboxypeptidase-like regulatory domain-containing protein [unclassified Dysgonomonas]MDH6355883.1 hypothetical protein [Dysgonomonas sp. PH5-45]MDH6388778.1 hypothetical protein [Dysgonomonas sp. PH5-37]
MRIKIVALFFLLFFFTSVVFAQKATIKGVVSDFDGVPMDYVSVTLKGTLTVAFTNSKGEYTLSANVGDSATVVFSYIGYKTEERKMLLDGNKNLNIMMRQDATLLDGVEIVGQEKQKTTIANIDVKKTKLMADPAGGGVESLLKTEMGVSSSNEMSSQYSVRGGSYDENIVYVNGTEIYRPLLIRSGQQEGLSFINPNMTSEVKFSSGGYDARYGDKMSSVLDITYKKPTKFEASAGASLMGANAYVGSASGRFTQITGIRYKTAKNLLGTTDTDAEYDPSFVDLQTYLTYSFGPKWEISFLGNYSKNEFKFTPISRETNFGTMTDAKSFKVFFDGWEHDKFQTYFGAMTMKGKITDKLEVGLQASAFSSDEQERYDIGGEYELTDANLDQGGGAGAAGNMLGVGTYFEHARNKLTVDVMNISHFGDLKTSNHNIKWGAILQREKIDDTIKEWELRDSAGYSLPYNGQIVKVYSNLISNNSAESTRMSGYLQDTYRFSGANGFFTLTAGVRASYWSFNKEFIFSPRATLAYVPAEGSDYVLRFATGVYYQAPFYKELQKTEVDEDGNSYVTLNKDIKSQRSIHFVLGGDYHFKALERPFKFTAEMYYKSLSDINPYKVDNVKIRYMGENAGSGYIMGLDMKLFGEFVPGTDSWISLSFLKANQKIDGVNVPMPTDQRYNLSLFFQDYLPGRERLKMSLQGHLSQGLPTSAPHSSYNSKTFRSPAYRRVDIGFSWELLGEDYAIRNRSAFAGAFKNVWLGLDVFNLFDIKNTNSYYWVTDIFNHQYGVPNYLTGRQLNFKIVADF